MSVPDNSGFSPATVRVKEERDWDGADDAAGLYAEHEVKDELVLGPERLQPQDIAYALHAPVSWSRGCPEAVKQELAEAAGAEMGSPREAPRPGQSCKEQAVPRTCSVRLERVPVDDKLHPCETCFKIFLHKTSLKTHICICRANDVKVKDSVEKKNISSVTCGEWFEAKSELIRHIHTKGNPCSGEVPKSGESKRPVINTEEKLYTCDVCKKQFSQKWILARHRLIHIGEKPHHCNICKKQFTRRSQLATHQIIHSEVKPYPCNICKKQFSNNAHLVTHRLIHTGEKPHHCNICKKQFSQKSNLAVHLLIHTGEKPHHCNICKKQFSQRSSLAKHRLTHTGEKPYHCNICKKQFLRKSYLAEHLLIHTGEKPYHCNICKKQFSQRSSLPTHRLTHTGEKPYHCNICKKQFSKKSSLDRHQVIHSREKPCKIDRGVD